MIKIKKHKYIKAAAAFLLLLYMLISVSGVLGTIGFSASNIQTVYAQSGNVKAQSFAGGDGNEDSPFLIATAAQLNNVRNYPGQWKSTGDITYSTGYRFKLACDIDMTDYLSEDGEGYNDGKGWEPIGTEDDSFKGVFDGARFTIRNFWINRPDNGLDGRYVGLFGFCENAVIKNIRLELSDFGIVGRQDVGGIAGELDNFNTGSKQAAGISGCSVTGEVTARSRVGGIVGSLVTATVETCAVYGNISGLYAAGGIVGDTYGGNILDCLYRGEITLNSAEDIKIAGAGGIAGLAYRGALIKNCFYEGEQTDARVAAIVGFRAEMYGDGKIYSFDGIIIYLGLPIISGCYYNCDVFSGKLTHIEDIIEVEPDAADYYGVGTSIPFAPQNSRALNAKEIKNKASFIGWDFDEVWGFTRDDGLTLRTFGNYYDPPPMLWLWLTISGVCLLLLFGAATVIIYKKRKPIIVTETVTVTETVYVQAPAQRLPESLSAREREVARLILEGCNRRALAKKLFVSESTVKKHIKSVCEKTDCASQKEFIVKFK